MNLKLISFIFLSVAIFYSACNNANMEGGGTANLDTELDTVSYSLGVSIAQNIKTQGLEEVNAAAFAQGIKDFYQDEENVKVTPDMADQLLSAYFTNLRDRKNRELQVEGEEFLESNKTKEGVQTTESGLQYKVIEEGSGEMPALEDQVRVHYTGKTIDGEVFDSSVDRGEPVTFQVNQVIPGWTEALQKMKVGGKWELYIPSDLAYGERGAGPNIPPNSVLIFDVELLGIGEEAEAENQ
ncbi:MAG: FKBP-type peptidyl-prolyl cis-trans isomerase [Candidatus Cyclobacteriaceae bacterium M3_2C_046]